jgi:hypothetical protein
MGFLALMLAVVGTSITSAGWVETPGLVLLLILSAVTAMMLARVRTPWFLLLPLGLFIGAAVVLWRTSLVIDAPSLTDRFREMFSRLDVWYEAATTGGISTDLMPFTILLLSATWLMGFIGSWFVFRHNNVWIAVVFAGVVLLTNLSFLPDHFATRFFLFILIAMLLIVRVSVIQRHALWQSVHIRYTPASGWLTIHAALWFSVLVLLVAALLPLKVVKVRPVAELWSFGRTPIARAEGVFTRLFSTLPSRKDLAGRFFGATLPFAGKISFGGEVVAWATTEHPSYWVSRTYDEYTSPGWFAGDTEKIEVGPTIPPPRRTDNLKRVSVNQTLKLNFSTDRLLSGGDFQSVSRRATLESLSPKRFTIDISDPSGDTSLPEEIQGLAAELRTSANLSRADAADLFTVNLPPDLVLLGIQEKNGGGVASITLQRTPPVAPDIVARKFDDKVEEDDSYQIESLVSVASDLDLRQAESSYDRFITDHYLQLPASLPQAVRDLSLELTEGENTALDKARAVLQYLRGPTFTYERDIEAPPTGTDGVAYFLFETQTGYSDYFASSMAVLLRAAGVPTRLAAGYSPGELDPESGLRFIRDSDSHGWVQVYFPGYGWIDFEPTPNWTAKGRGVGGPQGIELEEAGGDLGAEDLGITGVIEPLGEDMFGDSESGRLNIDSSINLSRYVLLPGIAIAVLAIVVLVSRLLWNLGMGPLTAEEKLYAKMARLGRIARLRLRSNQTPSEYAAVVGLAVPNAADAARSIATTYALSRYGHRRPERDELTELNEAWKRVRLSLIGRAFRRLIPSPSPQAQRQLRGG